MRLAISVARPNLVSLGTCFGKFTKSGKFKLHITALDYLAQYAKYKVRHALIIAYLKGRRFIGEVRSGSSRMERCPFCMATMSSRRILVALQKTPQNIRAWWCSA